MGFLEETFDIKDMPVEATRDFTPVPAGWYTASISGADAKDTKAGTGKYIAVRFDIIGPEYQGRVVWCNLNTRNPNPKAEEIGRQQLGTIMRAIGLAKLEDSDQLLGGSLQIKVTVKNDPNYGPGNEIKGFKAANGSAPPAVSKSKPAATASTATSASPPWAVK